MHIVRTLNSILMLMGYRGAVLVAQEHQSSVGLFIQTILSGKASLPVNPPVISSIEPGILLHPRFHDSEHPTISPEWVETEAHRVIEPPRVIARLDDVPLPHDTLTILVEHTMMIMRDTGGEAMIIRTEGNKVGMRRDASTANLL
jgi:hypothetical protein